MAWDKSEDIAKLRAALAELEDLTDDEIDWLYSSWSGQKASAGWLTVHLSNMIQFRRWATVPPIIQLKEGRDDTERS